MGRANGGADSGIPGRIGITVNIEKIPGANFRSVLVEKSRPMIINNFGGWLNYPGLFLLLRLPRAGCDL
jgi:hypothetical protein